MASEDSRNRAWLVLAAATALNFFGAIFYIWSVAGKVLVKSGWTSKQASLPYTTATLAFVISMVIMGRVQDRKGPRFVASISSILLGLGLIVCGLAKSPAMMMLGFGLLVGAGSGGINVSTVPPAMKWFPMAKKGLITGVVVMGIALSAVMYAPLTTSLIQNQGLSMSFMLLGAALIVILLVISQLLANPPVGFNPNGGVAVGPRRPTPAGPDADWKGMLKSSYFYKLWVMFIFSSAAGLMIFGHLVIIAKVQAKWEKGFLLLILLALFNAAGRFLGGALSDRIGRVSLMRIIFLVQAANMLYFSHYLTGATLACGVAVVGLCYGASFAAFPAATADAFGLRNFGANFGLVFTAWGAGGIIGPMTAAAILDSTKSYNSAYLVSAVLLLVAAGVAFTIRSAAKQPENLGRQEENAPVRN